VAKAIFVLGSLASTLCAVLLLRSYLAERVPLLFWSSVCFIWFALNNCVLGLCRKPRRDHRGRRHRRGGALHPPDQAAGLWAHHRGGHRQRTSPVRAVAVRPREQWACQDADVVAPCGATSRLRPAYWVNGTSHIDPRSAGAAAECQRAATVAVARPLPGLRNQRARRRSVHPLRRRRPPH
jgi:Family of unknown function (DUF5985)